MAGDFDYRILEQIAHRPWPLPLRPWIMTQTWNDLLFAHWAVDPAMLRDKVPAALPLDLHDGRAWLGLVPFHMTNVAPRGVPNLPFVSAFPELNLRTYVTLAGKPGVYFFSLDAASTIAVAAARTLFQLPYFSAAMSVAVSGAEVTYQSTRSLPGPARDPASGEPIVARFAARYHPVGPVLPPEPGTVEYFLTERYCLYSVDRAGRPRRLDIHHPRWPLQAAAAVVEVNTIAAAAGLTLPAGPPLFHFAKRQDAVAWRDVRCAT
jgi:uncharacterized protein YqjF (DUF2071 family)